MNFQTFIWKKKKTCNMQHSIYSEWFLYWVWINVVEHVSICIWNWRFARTWFLSLSFLHLVSHSIQFNGVQSGHNQVLHCEWVQIKQNENEKCSRTVEERKEKNKQQQVANVNGYSVDRVSSHAVGNRTMFFMGPLVNAGFSLM